MAEAIEIRCPVCSRPIVGSMKAHGRGGPFEAVFLSAKCPFCSGTYHFSDPAVWKTLQVANLAQEVKDGNKKAEERAGDLPHVPARLNG